MDIKKIKEDDMYVYYVDEFNSSPINIRISKDTECVFVNAKDICKVLGINKTIETILGSDCGLDIINELKKNNHGFTPLFFDAIKAKNMNKEWIHYSKNYIVEFLNQN